MVDPIAAEDYYFAHNHLYSPTALLDDTGDIIERCDYDAYGRPYFMEPNFVLYETQNSNYNNPYLFTGRRVDFLDNGKLTLQYSRNRYYDYHTGRWLTQDPLGQIDGVNLYQYVKSNPLIFSDAMGLWCGECLPPSEGFDNMYYLEIIEISFTSGATLTKKEQEGLELGVHIIHTLNFMLSAIRADHALTLEHFLGLAHCGYEISFSHAIMDEAFEMQDEIIDRRGGYLSIVVEYNECNSCKSVINWLFGGKYESGEWETQTIEHDCPVSEVSDEMAIKRADLVEEIWRCVRYIAFNPLKPKSHDNRIFEE